MKTQADGILARHNDDVVQLSGNLFSAEGRVGVKRQALARVLVDHCQHAYPATIRQPLSNKSHAPLFVPANGLALRHTLPLCPFLTLPCSHDQSLLDIQAVDPFGVHFPTLALQKDRQAPVAVLHSTAGQLPQTHP